MTLDIHPDLPADTVPTQVPGFNVHKIPCCYLLKHEQTNNVVKLNDTGMMIWQACTGEWSVGEIIEALKESYPDAAAEMDKDVFRALDNLRDEGVITLNP